MGKWKGEKSFTEVERKNDESLLSFFFLFICLKNPFSICHTTRLNGHSGTLLSILLYICCRCNSYRCQFHCSGSVNQKQPVEKNSFFLLHGVIIIFFFLYTLYIVEHFCVFLFEIAQFYFVFILLLIPFLSYFIYSALLLYINMCKK